MAIRAVWCTSAPSHIGRNAAFGMMMIMMCTIVPGVIVGEPSYRQKCKFTPEAVCCCLQTCNFGFDMRAIYTVPVHQVLPPDKLTLNKFLMPEAVCCCLQTCKCVFDIRVVLCTSVPSLIVRNANPTLVYKFLMPEAICCRFYKLVLTLEWYCVPVYQVSYIVRNVWCTKLNRVKPTKCVLTITYYIRKSIRPSK